MYIVLKISFYYNKMKSIKVGDFTCKVGQNAKENWELLDNSNENFWFFHLTSFPSCYVIWENKGRIPNDTVLEQLAKICIAHTKYRRFKNVKVDYTRCRNVRKGEKIGELEYIFPRKVKTVKLVPDLRIRT